MTQMVFRHGDMNKWKGVGYDFEIINTDSLSEYLDAGWFAHPDELLESSAEPEPEPEPEPAKKQRKGKSAASDSAEEFV